MTSTETPLTFDYYVLPFCRPAEVKETAENLGEALIGDKAALSMMQVIVRIFSLLHQ